MKIATENLHLILTEELYKVDEIDKTTTTDQTIPPEPPQSQGLPLEIEKASLSPGLQVITEPLTETSRGNTDQTTQSHSSRYRNHFSD